jgi:hypothetical protein
LIYPLPYYLTHVARGRYSYPVEPFVVLLAAVPLAGRTGAAHHRDSLSHPEI